VDLAGLASHPGYGLTTLILDFVECFLLVLATNLASWVAGVLQTNWVDRPMTMGDFLLIEDLPLLQGCPLTGQVAYRQM
jgi:hypothetical protein